MFTSLVPVFERYERLAAGVDALFEGVRERHADCVSCLPGCSDCCHAVFDLPLVEALYLNRAFQREISFGPLHSEILNAAGKADRKGARLKRALYKASQKNTDEAIMEEAARARVRCPLLDAGDRCLLYAWRPITCRLYGIPAEIGGATHVCGKTRFVKGRPYPSVKMGKIQERLADMSREIVRILGSRLKELHLVYVPVSTALLAEYDAAYLGTAPAGEENPA
jgi:Fe-S-cluster containining protein